MSGNISYNTNIPFATNNPSNDQPLMDQNTNALNTWTGVDHVGFNVGGGFNSGQHLQVTFNSDNVPSLPTGNDPSGNKIGVLFTKTVGAGTINQLFYYAGSAAQSSTQYNLTGTASMTGSGGSTFLFGGIIIKWGVVNIMDNNTVFFATNGNAGASFPNACLGVSLQLFSASSSNNIFLSVSPTPTKDAFTPRIIQGGSGVSATFFYFAIGN